MPLYLLEATSASVEAFLLAQAPGSVVVSLWGKVEFASMLARNVRMGLQEQAKAAALFRVLEQDLARTFQLHAPTQPDFDLAADLVLKEPRLGLRGGDALHLATARNHNLTLYTLDKTLLEAANTLGVAASDAGIL